MNTKNTAESRKSNVPSFAIKMTGLMYDATAAASDDKGPKNGAHLRRGTFDPIVLERVNKTGLYIRKVTSIIIQ